MPAISLTVAPPITLRFPRRILGGLAAVILTLAAPAMATTGAPGCTRSLDQLTLRHFGVEDDLPLDTVYALARDRRGFLWVGTEDGLARFDGAEFRRWDLGEVLEGDAPFVRALAHADDETLYVGVASSGVIALDTGPGGSERRVIDLLSLVEALQPVEGGLLVGSRSEGLIRLAGRETEIIETQGPHRPVRAITPSQGGGYWVGFDGEGIQRLVGNRLQPAPFEDLPNRFVSALLEDDAGTLWIGTREGLFSWDGRRITAHGKGVGLPDRVHVVSLYQDRFGHLWAGTGGDGVARKCNGQEEFTRFGLEGELGRAHINDMVEDHEGGLWLASGGEGLYQMTRGPAVPIGEGQGLPPFPVLPITQDQDGAMWLGTFGGGVARLGHDDVRIFDESNSKLIGNRILSLAPDPRAGVWVGGRIGLVRIEGERVEKPFARNFSTVSAILAEEDQVWIGSVDSIYRARGNSVETIPVAEGEIAGHVLMIRRDTSGLLWVSTDSDGLYQFDEASEQLHQAPFNEQLPSRSVFDMLESPDGTFWLATSRGIVYRKGQTQKLIDSRHGLAENIVFSIREDGLGWIWLSGNRGVFRIREEQLRAVAAGERSHMAVQHFDRLDGMPRSETNGGFQYPSWRDHSGRLWYPTSEGAAVFDPSTMELDGRQLAVVITGAGSDTGTLAISNGVEVAPGTDWLRLNYTAPAFRRPSDVAFRYRLTGFEESWFVTRERSAVYRQPPPGDYLFEVQARRTGGTWSPSYSVPILVERHWFEYPAFWLSASVFVIVASAALLLWRARVRSRRREQLAQAQKLEAVGLLAGGIAHDFNNVLAAIMNGTEVLCDHLPPDSEARRDAEQVIKAAERGAGLTQQLLTFSRRQKVTPQWVDLSGDLADMREFVERLLPATIELDWRVDSSVGQCLIDRVQLQQVIINLVVNARDAMDRRGRISVRLFTAKAAQLAQAGLDSGAARAAIEVTDTGPGLSPKMRHRIFEPFFTTKSAGRGTGLGLSVAYGIVDQAGGWIGVSSPPGQGATFTVLLPVRPSWTPPR